ncbi:MAG: hypothetical protein ACFFDC_17965 [Promethearchaeota archaeon]
MMQVEEKDDKQSSVRTIAGIWMVVGILAIGLGLINSFIMGIMSTGGEAYQQTVELARFSMVFWIIFGVGAVLVGFGLWKFNFVAWIVFEIQTGLATLVFLFYTFSGGLFALEFFPMEFVYFTASLGCLVLLVFAYTLRDQFRAGS